MKTNNIVSDALLNPFGSIVLCQRLGQNGKRERIGYYKIAEN
jgi:hypothetical protein